MKPAGARLEAATPGCACGRCRMIALHAEFVRAADEMLAQGAPEAASAMAAAADRLEEVLIDLRAASQQRN